MEAVGGTEPGTVAARLMGLWEKDPFTKEVNLDKPWGCPLCQSPGMCGTTRRKGRIREWVTFSCPEILKDGKRGAAPPECPLRFGPIMVRAKG